MDGSKLVPYAYIFTCDSIAGIQSTKLPTRVMSNIAPEPTEEVLETKVSFRFRVGSEIVIRGFAWDDESVRKAMHLALQYYDLETMEVCNGKGGWFTL